MAQSGECLPSTHGVLGSRPQHCINKVWWHMPIILVFCRWREEGQKFKFILTCIRSSRISWVTQMRLCLKQRKKRNGGNVYAVWSKFEMENCGVSGA